MLFLVDVMASWEAVAAVVAAAVAAVAPALAKTD
jgi:hypothetical protein